MAPVNRIMFSSKEHLPNAEDIYDYGGRFWFTSPGRWGSRDPLGERGDLNLYRGMFNSPLNVVDRNGRDNMNPTPEQMNANSVNNAPVNMVFNMTFEMREIVHPSIPVLQAEGSPPVPTAPEYVERMPTGNYSLSSEYGGDDPLMQYALWTGGTAAALVATDFLGEALPVWLAGMLKAKCPVKSGFGDLTPTELGAIQKAVDETGTQLTVVGSAARGERTAASDIDYLFPMPEFPSSMKRCGRSSADAAGLRSPVDSRNF